MSLEAAFREVIQRNAVRRQAGLPLLDVHAEVLKAERAREWNEATGRHHDELVRLREVVRKEFTRRTGQDYLQSAGGRWAVHLIAYKQFVEFLVQKGHVPPQRRLVGYGEQARSAHASSS